MRHTFNKIRSLLLGLMLCICGGFVVQSQAESIRRVKNFDANWRFFQGEAQDGQQIGFEDSSWRQISVPHDWAIAGPFDPRNPTGGAGAFLPSGVGWYRKHFALPASDEQRRIFIQFDGVMANSDVWINGTLLGHRPNGYVSFRYELTGYIHFGLAADNVIAVRCDTSKQPASRWYEGAGIYRHVRLIVTGPVHVAQWATFVGTPQVTDAEATVHVETKIRNRGSARKNVGLEIRLYSPNGRLAASAAVPEQTIAAGDTAQYARDLRIARPDRWDISHPVLYRAVVLVRADGHTVDDDAVSFGIREFHFNAATGFWLNGHNLKLYGVCLHSDGGAFGIAVPLDIRGSRRKFCSTTGRPQTAPRTWKASRSTATASRWNCS